MNSDYENLIDSLIKDGYLKTPEIIEAFRIIDRINFVREEDKKNAYINAPLSIGFDQTISQPLTVAFMLELLEPKKGEKILDIGAGSGWTTALLAQIVSQELNSKFKNQKSKLGGRVIAIDIVPELVEFGKNNVAKYSFIKKGVVDFVCADGYKGFEEEMPFDKILVSAATQEIPSAWKKQLKIGGRIVAPISQSIFVIDKIDKDQFNEKEYFGFSFVPLVKSH